MPSTVQKSEMSNKVQVKRLDKKRSISKISRKQKSEQETFSPKQNHDNQNNIKVSSTLPKTPKKRKRSQRESLLSELSPKYIGYSPTLDGKRLRNSKKKFNVDYNKSTSPSASNIIENEGILTNNLCIARLTPVSIKYNSPSFDDTNCSLEFESPIEKLIKKNKELSKSPCSIANEQDEKLFMKSPNHFPLNKKQKEDNNEKVFNKINNETLSEIFEVTKNKSIEPNQNNLEKQNNDEKITKSLPKDNIKIRNVKPLVPLKKNLCHNTNMSENIESTVQKHEITIRSYKNTPVKIRSPHIVLHKSPQIEQMQKNIRRKINSNSKIFQTAKILSQMTEAEDKTDNLKETNSNFLGNVPNIDGIFEITDSLSNLISTEMKILDESSKNIDKLLEICSDTPEISTNINPQNQKIVLSEELQNIEMNLETIQPIPSLDEIVELLNEPQLLAINAEISTNEIQDISTLVEENLSKFEDDDDIPLKNLTTNISETLMVKLDEPMPVSVVENVENSKILCSQSEQTLNSLKTDLSQNKFNNLSSESDEIETSELAFENILFENDHLGTTTSADDDVEILNISQDLLDLENLESENLQKKMEKDQKSLDNTDNVEIEQEQEKEEETLIANEEEEENALETQKTENLENEMTNIELTEENAPVQEETIPTTEETLNVKTPISILTPFTEISEPTNSSIISQTQSNEIITGMDGKNIDEETSTLNSYSTSITELQTAPNNEAFAFTLLNNARAIKSPLSTDSAKGSSIDIETNFHPKFGEIFWARISKYPFWPCIVWPDPDGKTISIGKSGVRQHIRIHVRFFADNGRRSWVRKEDLMAYNGREDFERKKKEFWEKNNTGKKNVLARAFLVNESKKPLWNQSIVEAGLVLNEHIEKRKEKFEKILEETRELQFFERRKKRNSISERSSVYSTTGSDDFFNSSTGSVSFLNRKRERSPTPESPAFENVDDFKTFVKKRKIHLQSHNSDGIKKTSSLLQLDEISASNSNLYESTSNIEEFDFNSFNELIKSFIQPEIDDENLLFKNLKEIWEIKLRADATKIFKLNNENKSVDGENNLRFSTRLTTLGFRKSLPSKLPSPLTLTIKDKLPKVKKERGVPIDKVVIDILELNKNYLFRDLKREPVCKVCLEPGDLYKCSGSCQHWIHKNCVDLPAATTFPPPKSKEKKIILNNNTNINNYNNTTSNNNNEIANIAIKVTEDCKTIETNNDQSPQNNETVNSESFVQPIEIICKECKENISKICFVCKQIENELNDVENKITLIKCKMNNCGKYFHQDCLKYWPQARLTKSKDKIERFICPSHTCQTCISDDPKSKFIKLQYCAKCILCPASYHVDSTCIPAGSKILTVTDLICPRHRSNKLTLNTNWCFICSDGGNLVCCESCPTSFHIECLNIAKLPEAGYICEECETGRMPLYGELVWAKFGVHKWWPCITIPPPQIPRNLLRIKRREFDFCVRFFGTNDHTWISRDRVFLYQEDDWRYSSKVKSNDKDFSKALEEANSISEMLKSRKLLKKDNEKKMLLLPTPYKKIYVNRPVPPIKLQDIDVNEELNPCNCGKDDKNCDIFSRCLNRLLMIECHPNICPAREKCKNHMFEKRMYAATKVVRTGGKGFGLVSDEFIPAGTFVIEYVGELIDDNELKRRIAQKQEEKDENYYFLTMQNGLIIDAGPKGNMARFMNHSCEPNCETQKWNVNGYTRIGLFTICDVPLNTELTFNYNLECIGDDKKLCHCGAKRCSGFIGAKYKKPEKKLQENLTTDISKQEKPNKTKGKKTKTSSSSAASSAASTSASASTVPISNTTTTIPKSS